MTRRLTDPQHGVAADDVRRAVGLSPVARVEELERRCERLERTLTMVLRTFRGFDLEGGDAYVTPEPGTGMIRLHSIDGTLTIQDEPTGEAHCVNLEVTAPGCTETWNTITSQNGEIDTDSCGEHISYRGYDTQNVVRVETHGVEGDDSDILADRVVGTYVDTPLAIAGYVWLWTDNAGWVPLLVGADPGGDDPDPGEPPQG
jgi:hypothetical protein